MTTSSAATPAEYLSALPDDRCSAIAVLRQLILEHLPSGYVEAMRWGMLSYEVPLSVYPHTYNGQPLNYGGLAAQKQKNSLYLMSIYQDPAQFAELMEAFSQDGLKADMGKSCLRFKRPEELPLKKIGEIITRTAVEDYIRGYEASRRA